MDAVSEEGGSLDSHLIFPRKLKHVLVWEISQWLRNRYVLCLQSQQTHTGLSPMSSTQLAFPLI